MAIFKLLVPVSLGFLIDWFADPETVEFKLISPEIDGYLWALIFGLGSLLNALIMGRV